MLDLKLLDKTAVEESLKQKDLVWVMGGNTFYLNFLLHKSGFKDVIKKLLKEGLVYGGESAGAVVAGSTLHGIEYLDDPKLSPEVIWEGLKLFDFGIIPHWGLSEYGESLLDAKREMERYAIVSTIDNDKALEIEGEELEIINN
jgi:dipeptidase E